MTLAGAAADPDPARRVEASRISYDIVERLAGSGLCDADSVAIEASSAMVQLRNGLDAGRLPAAATRTALDGRLAAPAWPTLEFMLRRTRLAVIASHRREVDDARASQDSILAALLRKLRARRSLAATAAEVVAWCRQLDAALASLTGGAEAQDVSKKWKAKARPTAFARAAPRIDLAWYAGLGPSARLTRAGLAATAYRERNGFWPGSLDVIASEFDAEPDHGRGVIAGIEFFEASDGHGTEIGGPSLHLRSALPIYFWPLGRRTASPPHPK